MSARSAAAAAPRGLFGMVARTARGRERLATDFARVRPSTFPERGWWRSSDGAVALHAPRRDGRGARERALAFDGWLYSERGPVDHEGELARLQAALLRHPESALSTCRGPYVLAAWDGSQLLLVRDPLGQRGLFLRADDDLYLFSGELEPLLRDPAFSCQLDFGSAVHYLACGLPQPGRTLADRVSSLPAAHRLRITPGEPPRLERHWTPLREEASKAVDDETRHAVAAALERAIVSRLERRGEQALLLSGGVDSSLLVTMAAARLGGARTHAYTIEFTPRYRKNETEYAALVAQAAGARHHVVSLQAPQAVALLEPTLARAEPCSAWAAVTHRRLLGEIAGHGQTALLSGLGADEIFGGYQHLLEFYFRARDHQKRWRGAPSSDPFEALLHDRQLGRRALYPGIARFFTDDALARGLAAPYRRWHFASHLEEFYRDCRRLKPRAHVFEMMIAHECQRRIPDLLFANFEPIAREHGVRTAYPFLDPELIRHVSGLGAASRYRNVGGVWWNKQLLRELAAPRLPALILARRPTSYTAPFADWMSEPVFARPTLARLRRSRLWKLGLLRPTLRSRLERQSAAGAARPAPWVDELWATLTLAAWVDRYVERRA